MNSLPLESKKTIEKLWYIFLNKKGTAYSSAIKSNNDYNFSC